MARTRSASASSSAAAAAAAVSAARFLAFPVAKRSSMVAFAVFRLALGFSAPALAAPSA
eukprot:CAMPEP_0170134616 /NCGR_PEP_ID=MMETSP0033_2-20121228/2012_1 /TAXON_ID=195969 /ORGANISM="Dolichomastix tenuilepis, Strain CCMP3274" /LENGTH=58 /DNA_ID=CAMNT_0010370183 /DNA_START=228 /DNA_END=401 /DNA_ORIENTATION=+